MEFLKSVWAKVKTVGSGFLAALGLGGVAVFDIMAGVIVAASLVVVGIIVGLSYLGRTAREAPELWNYAKARQQAKKEGHTKEEDIERRASIIMRASQAAKKAAEAQVSA